MTRDYMRHGTTSLFAALDIQRVGDRQGGRATRSIEMLDDQTRQVRNRDAESLKIARPA
jgi:hypothetical protein